MGDVVRFGLTAFVTLLVVVDPFGVVPIFVSLTEGAGAQRRAGILRRALAVAFGVSMFFLLAGRGALSYLGVTVHAFAISGGVLLFLTALPMLFGQRGGLQAPERGEPVQAGADISIFPLAIPLLSGPGAITTILLFTAQAGSDLLRLLVLALAIAAVFVVARFVLRQGERLVEKVGEGGVHIVTRVMGILLAALAVQFVLDGVTSYSGSLAPR